MKKILAVLTAACLVFGMVGCQQNNDVSAEQDVQDSVEIAEMKTIEPPENGWTLEELNEVLYLNGQQIQLPLMFSSLKDGYEIRDKLYKSEASHNNDVVGGYLYYENYVIAMITFYELETDIEILNLYFFTDMYEVNQDYTDYININGFGLKNNVNDVYDFLGNEFENKDDLLLKYNIENSNYSITVCNIEDFWISIKCFIEENEENN